MRATRHDRSFRTRSTYLTLVSFLIWSMVSIVPPSASAAELPLGLATGSKEAHIAADGKQWVTLPASSNPVYEGTMIRTGKGTASALLKDGTQLELQPGTLIGFSGSRTAPVVKIAVGRVLFRLPASSRTVFATPTVRSQLEVSNLGDRTAIVKAKAATLSSTDAVGQIVVNPRGGSRIGLQQGEMLTTSVSDPGLHLVKAGQSVYIPQVGNPDPGFSVMLAQALPEEQAGGGGTSVTADAEDTTVGGPMTGGAATGMGTESAVGLVVGLGVVGAGIGLGVAFSGPASPSTP